MCTVIAAIVDVMSGESATSMSNRVFRTAVAALVIVCALAAGCGNSADGAAGGDTVAIVRGGMVFLTDGELETLTPIDAEDVADVAFDTDGELWFSTRHPDADPTVTSCDLHSRSGIGRVSGGVLVAATDRNAGGCEIATGPDGTLYTVTHNGTLASELVAQVDPRSGATRDVLHGGSAVASTPDGKVMSALEYRSSTHPRGMNAPVLTFVDTRREPVELEPDAGDDGGYGAPAPRDAQTLAAVQDHTIAVGPPSGPLEPRCALDDLDDGDGIDDLAWRSDGHIYARTWEGRLYVCAPGGDMRLLGRSVEALAVR